MGGFGTGFFSFRSLLIFLLVISTIFVFVCGGFDCGFGRRGF